MELVTIDKIIEENEYILIDKSSLCFGFDNFYGQSSKVQIPSENKTMEYWVNVFEANQDNFKFYLPEKGINEVNSRDYAKVKRLIKKTKKENNFEDFRFLNESAKLSKKINNFFGEENFIRLNLEQQVRYLKFLNKSKNKIIGVNKWLNSKNKDFLSEPDLDYFLTAVVLSDEGKKVSLITNDGGLSCLAGNFAKKNNSLNYDVYFHSILGKFEKFA